MAVPDYATAMTRSLHPGYDFYTSNAASIGTR